MAITILDENDKKELEQKIEDAGKSATADAEAAASSATAAQTAQGKAETAQGEAEESAEAAASSAAAAQTAQGKAEAAQAATESAKAEVEQKLANGDYKGEDGYTPVAGVDYPTDAQIDTKIAAALAERNQLEPLIAESVDWLNENGDPT